MVANEAVSDEDDVDDLVSKISDVTINKNYDLKHLSPLIVVNDESQKLLTSPIRTEANRNFQGAGITKMSKEDVFSDYYKFNKNNHFVWTNQNVIQKGTEVDTHLMAEPYNGNFNYENCNLKNPDKSFELRQKDKFGFGLYAKHNISKGSFSLLIKFGLIQKT